jgi:hypothetical protein
MEEINRQIEASPTMVLLLKHLETKYHGVPVTIQELAEIALKFDFEPNSYYVIFPEGLSQTDERRSTNGCGWPQFEARKVRSMKLQWGKLARYVCLAAYRHTSTQLEKIAALKRKELKIAKDLKDLIRHWEAEGLSTIVDVMKGMNHDPYTQLKLKKELE